MSECRRLQCQRDRRLIRREFSQWTENLLLQIGLETLAKNHLDADVNLFNDEPMPVDFNPHQTCLFCLNRKEYLSTVKTYPAPSYQRIDNDVDLHSSFYPSLHFPFDIAHPSNYLTNFYSSFHDNPVDPLAKQMAYLRMLEEIDYQRRNLYKSQTRNIPSLLTDVTHVNRILHGIMLRMTREVFQEQIQQQQSNVFRQGKAFFTKEQNDNKDNITMINARKQQQDIPTRTSSSSNTSSVSNGSFTSMRTKTKSIIFAHHQRTPF